LAIRATPVDAPDPGNSDTTAGRELFRAAGDYLADDLMAGSDSFALWNQLAFDNMQIGATNPARSYL
jgi:hypothetical protein